MRTGVDTMRMNVCRYVVEETEVHSCLCWARTPHSPGGCDPGDFKVCLLSPEFYYQEEVGVLQV